MTPSRSPVVLAAVTAGLAAALVAATIGPADAASSGRLSPGIAGHTWALARIQDAARPGPGSAPAAPAVLAVPRSGPVTLGTGCTTQTRRLSVPAAQRFALTGGGPVTAMCTRTGQPVQDAVLTAFSGPVSYSLRRDGTLRVTGQGETLVYRRTS